MTTAVRTAVEVWRAKPETGRAKAALDAFLSALQPSGFDAVQTDEYRGNSEWLLLWGPGHPDRVKAIAQHVAAGGHAIALDLAYWNRSEKVRITIDAPHPQRWVMRQAWSASRWHADPAPVADVWKPDGPIIVAGIGKKAKTQYGDAVDAWEGRMMQACAVRWPDRLIQYRAKPVVPDPQIDRGLTGASLVITWHSNVAVDAIRLGIPVICRDGAAAAICPSTFGVEEPAPLHGPLRDRFLRNLAWFQWAPTEASTCWSWIQEALSS